MIIISLYRFFSGYVEIMVSGEFCEKILNLLAVNRVNVWDIKKDINGITLKLSIKDYKNIRKIRGKSKLKIKILKKFGFKFLLKKYKLRIGIPVGISLFLIIINLLSCYIWNITVVGNSNVSETEILKACECIGVKNGVRTSKLNSQLLRERLLLNCDKLSWCSFNIEGSKVTVNVTEIKNEKGENIPCNIVSDYNGIITEIIVESGTPVVVKDDTVSKGDLLVSGIVDAGGYNKFLNAKATIKAKITESLVVFEKFNIEKTVLNGKVKEKTVFEFFGIKIPLYLGKVSGEYTTSKCEKNFSVCGEKLPLKVYKKVFNMCEKENVSLTRDELLINISDKMEEKISEIPEKCEIISRKIEESDDEVALIYEISYIKNIGIKENLIFDVSN